MQPKIRGLFRETGIPIAVKLLSSAGTPAGIAAVDHSHDFVELLIVRGGRGTHRVDGHDYALTAGHVFVVHGDQTHAFTECRDLQWIEVPYHAARLRLPTGQLKKMPGYHALFVLEPNRRRAGHYRGHLQLSPTRLAEAIHLVEGMHREYAERPAGYEAALLARLIELIVFLSREYPRSSTGEGRSLLRVAEVIGLLEREFHRPWRLEELCEAAHMSKSSLLVVFREATGQTPIDYLVHVRLRQAMELLQSTDQTVTEIAYDVGFSDSNYFARKFREVVGTTPSAYRRSAW